jgi:hypothetical protein
MDIDKQRIAAVRTLQSLGYIFQGGEWIAASAASNPAMPVIPVIPEADAMHGLLMRCADALAGCEAVGWRIRKCPAGTHWQPAQSSRQQGQPGGNSTSSPTSAAISPCIRREGREESRDMLRSTRPRATPTARSHRLRITVWPICH